MKTLLASLLIISCGAKEEAKLPEVEPRVEIIADTNQSPEVEEPADAPVIAPPPVQSTEPNYEEEMLKLEQIKIKLMIDVENARRRKEHETCIADLNVSCRSRGYNMESSYCQRRLLWECPNPTFLALPLL